MAAIPTYTSKLSLQITAAAFRSFATPAITVPFPSAYQQTQIPFAYSATPTWAATRIPTTYGGIAATNGISTALAASGTHYGTSGTGGSGGGWPKWATGVIVGCGIAVIVIVLAGIWCWCTRGRRSQKARRRAKVLTEKHVGGGAARSKKARAARDKLQKLHRDKRDRATEKGVEASFFGVPGIPDAAHAKSTYQPYPPRPVDGTRTPSPHRGAYPVPLLGAYGRDSVDTPSGYRTPTDLDVPGYVDGGSEFDSPARLWVSSDGGTPRSSLSASRRAYERDVLTPPMPVAGSNLARRWEQEEEEQQQQQHAEYYEDDSLPYTRESRHVRTSSLPTPSSPDFEGRRHGRRPRSHEHTPGDEYERQALQDPSPRYLFPEPGEFVTYPRSSNEQHRSGRQASSYVRHGFGRHT